MNSINKINDPMKLIIIPLLIIFIMPIDLEGIDGKGVKGFRFTCEIPHLEELYQLALSEVEGNIANKGEKNVRFMAGKHWTGLWTRDVSYSIQLGVGFTHPDISKSSLHQCTEEVEGIGKCWLQDKCGHFGGWPNLTDAIVGVLGAWSLYKFTGDRELLKWSYNLTINSLERAERDAYDKKTGLFMGCSSFMESNSGYPKKYSNDGEAVGKTKALSTNVLYYNGYKIAARMGELLGESTDEIERLKEREKSLKDAIRKRLWLEDVGYYSYFEDENGNTTDRMEGLGESLVILTWLEEDMERINSIFENVYRTSNGIPCLWPQWPPGFEGYPIGYHNGQIWPFVQGYWAWAAASHYRVKVFEEELFNLVSIARNENTFGEFYRTDGTLSFGDGTRRRQLWSAAGYLSMIYHGLFGMYFKDDGIKFSPVVPDTFNLLKLQDIDFRNMTLDIIIQGSGTNIESFKLDGEEKDKPFISNTLKGEHVINIKMIENR